MSKRYMRAYYNTFTPTGNDAVDAILEAIALAGKAYHNTSEWGEPVEYGAKDGPCFWDLIQEAANNAAKAPAPEARSPDDGGITQALVQMARDNAIEECARIADKHRGRFYEHDKYGADIGGEIRRLLSEPQSNRPQETK